LDGLLEAAIEEVGLWVDAGLFWKQLSKIVCELDSLFSVEFCVTGIIPYKDSTDFQASFKIQIMLFQKSHPSFEIMEKFKKNFGS
jgi:hypothetical protein